MKLKISTPSQIIYEGDVDSVQLPTENGNLTIKAGHAPMVTSIKSGIITLYTHPYLPNATYISTAKGMAFVDGKIVRIVSADATVNPSESTDTLNDIKHKLEEKIHLLRNQGSIEELEKMTMKLEKINADLKLKSMLH